MRLLLPTSAFLLGMASAAAIAQDRIDGPAMIGEIGKCRAIVADAARLACFDRTAAPLVAAQERGKLLVLDRERTVARRRARFGLMMEEAPAISPDDKRDRDEDPLDIREITTTVSSVVQSGSSRYNLALANGSVWQTVEPMRFSPARGSAITIRSAALGSFKAVMPKLQTVKVKRVR